MKIAKKLATIVLFAGLTTITFAQSTTSTPPAQDADQGVKSDVKEAGRSTERAAKKMVHKTKNGAKKATHKAAKKTRQGAERVEDKTETHPQ